MSNIRYVVITPVRNEEQFLGDTIESMVSQTILPQQWIIVDDGSADKTASMALAAAKKYQWIEVIQRKDRGSRKPGGGVIEAFYDGYRHIKEGDWQFLVKLDGDLSFSREYFEKCFTRFNQKSKLGIGGGVISKMVQGELEAEAKEDPVFHVRGATKIYARDCWDALGGLIQAAGWDTVDEYKANMLGWTTSTFPEIYIHHLRAAGEAQGAWKNWVKNGLANYVAGYHPLFMAIKCVRRAFRKPYGLGGIGLFIGFLSGYGKRIAQVDDKELIRYLRQQQMQRLFLRPSLWDQKPG